jgi:hypothetical protein
MHGTNMDKHRNFFWHGIQACHVFRSQNVPHTVRGILPSNDGEVPYAAFSHLNVFWKKHARTCTFVHMLGDFSMYSRA